MARRLIPFEDLKAKGIRFSKPHLWRLEKADLFPRRVRVGSGNGGRNSYTWVEDEIDAHVEKLIETRDAEPRDISGGKTEPSLASRRSRKGAAR